MDNIIFCKTKANAIIPSKEEGNAGYDIYACFTETYMMIKPQETRLIPTGIASAFSSDYYIQIEERGSTGSKGIKKSAGVIDSNYRGEWFIAITNTTEKFLIIAKDNFITYNEQNRKTDMSLVRGINDDYIYDSNKLGYSLASCQCLIYPYKKAIAQAIVHYSPKMNIVRYKDDYDSFLKEFPSDRGIGKLGSSGK